MTTRQVLVLGEVSAGRRSIGRSVRIPMGKGDAAVAPPWEAPELQSMMALVQLTPKHVLTKRWPRRSRR